MKNWSSSRWHITIFMLFLISFSFLSEDGIWLSVLSFKETCRTDKNNSKCFLLTQYTEQSLFRETLLYWQYKNDFLSRLSSGEFTCDLFSQMNKAGFNQKSKFKYFNNMNQFFKDSKWNTTKFRIYCSF